MMSSGSKEISVSSAGGEEQRLVSSQRCSDILTPEGQTLIDCNTTKSPFTDRHSYLFHHLNDLEIKKEGGITSQIKRKDVTLTSLVVIQSSGTGAFGRRLLRRHLKQVSFHLEVRRTLKQNPETLDLGTM